ncbi:isoleucine--tRNA ligase [Myxococcota bacterium]|nr:isoleucine--tRNA ligase [Myxococcota bacterium]
MSKFQPIPEDFSFPQAEARIISLWETRRAFERSVAQRPKSAEYVFYDGPPFATGLPHYGHLVASTLKDIVPRYWAMRGHRVERRFGWDTHGLPIEMEMEQSLGLSGPTSVKQFGVGQFNEACRANVMRYTQEWRRTVTRLGRWVDFDHDYKTMDLPFMESVWWVFGQLWDKGLVYEGFRVMPFSWRLSTSLSNFEAGSDYRDVQDPAITVTMPLVDRDEVLLVWTTTPWTLPSNLAVAVGVDVDYVRAKRPGDDTVYILSPLTVERALGKDAEILSTLKGSELLGLRYTPLFDYFADRAALGEGEGRCFVTIAAEHVTAESGTGLVHMAPDFGEEDYIACQAHGIQVVQSVDDEGNFREMITAWAGQNVKAADPDIIRALKAMGRLIKQETINHSYPFCWRSGTPLIYKAVPARFVKVTALRDRMVAHNKEIHWVPEAVGAGRFGNWLEDARDWNISRNRFWGTPIPIWRCPDCGHEVCVKSIAELQQRTGALVDDLHPHRIDHLTFGCEACSSGEMARIPDVFDCWFESGAMPYAQGHYPFEDKEKFEAAFPAEFIAEGLDQTRGWFYTLLVLSTALFDKPPFKNVIVNGMVLAEDGTKMSKSKRNYPPPDDVLSEFGADALRVYLIDSPVVRAEPLKFSEKGVREVVRTVMLPMKNVWSFFTRYANIDGWTPQAGLEGVETPDVAARPELDRWLLSVMQSLVAEVNVQMEGYYLYKVVPPVLGFIDHLTNWYIRRSRRRFWRSAEDHAGRVDKAAAYATLYEVLVTFSKVMAPMMPFMAEGLYQHLVVDQGMAEEGLDSVHLCDYPQVDAGRIDAALEAAVAYTRAVVSMGRALRERHNLKTRQPLAEVIVVDHDPHSRAAVEAHAELIAEELNVKRVSVREDGAALATVSFKANFKRLGRRYGKQMKQAAEAIAALSVEDWRALRDGGELIVEGQPITAEDVLVQREARGDVVIEASGAVTVALETELSEALLAEGLAREVISRLQRARKAANLEITDRIVLALGADSGKLSAALEAHRAYIAEEVLAAALTLSPQLGEGEVMDVDGYALSVMISKVE